MSHKIFSHDMEGQMQKRSCLPEMLIVWVVLGAVPARADLALTPAGIADGFILTTFASGLPNVITEGPFGVTLASNGNVIAFDYASSTRYVFPDVDGQTPATAIFAQTGSTSSAEGYATAGGKPYGGRWLSLRTIQRRRHGEPHSHRGERSAE